MRFRFFAMWYQNPFLNIKKYEGDEIKAYNKMNFYFLSTKSTSFGGLEEEAMIHTCRHNPATSSKKIGIFYSADKEISSHIFLF